MIVKININKASSSAYLLKFSNLWYDRSGHVNYDTLRMLINFNHILAFLIDPKHKCETCIEANLRRSSFKSVERNSEPLNLIYSVI